MRLWPAGCMAHSHRTLSHWPTSVQWAWYQNHIRSTSSDSLWICSVNVGISPSLCSLHYSSVDEAADIRYLGRETQLVKLDVKDAYCLISVHPDDYHLLGISWRGETYIDCTLPFGLRSAPKYSAQWQTSCLGCSINMALSTSYITWMTSYLGKHPTQKKQLEYYPWYLRYFVSWVFPS